MKKQTVELTESEWLNVRSALLTRADQMSIVYSSVSLASKYREIEDKIGRQTREQTTNQQ